MPVVKISSIKDLTRTSTKGKKYKVTEVKGTKYGSEEEWSTDIFKNNAAVLEQLDDFGPGELANFSFKKNGNFYDLVSVTTPTEENLEYAKKNADKGSGGPAKSTSSSMTKEEWAEKDRRANIGRAIHNSLKYAVMNTKINESPKKIMEMAAKFVPFLMIDNLDDLTIEAGAKGKAKAKKDDKDPLDPPV